MQTTRFDQEFLEVNMDFLQTLEQRILVLDGAMGTEIQALGLTDEDFGGTEFRMLSDLLVFSKPPALKEIHLHYYRAGAHAVETNTFGASPFRLSEYDFGDLDVSHFDPLPFDVDLRTITYETFAYLLSLRGAEIACEARDEYRRDPSYDGRPLFVIGSVGPSNRVLSSTDADLRESTFDEVGENFRHQVLGLIDGGADVILFETQQDILETKAAVAGAQMAMRERGKPLPIMCQVTVDAFSKMQIFHTDIEAAIVTCAGIGIDTFGINCSIGPDQMEGTVKKLSTRSPLPISIIPNAGLPESENGRTVFKYPPDKMAAQIKHFVTEYGVNIVGGCCGTSRDHIRAIAEAVADCVPIKRDVAPRRFISGPQQAVELDSSEGLIMSGERLNVRGSKKVRDAVEGEGDIDQHALEEVVRDQVDGLGVSVIDVCMDSNVVNTEETLAAVVHRQTADFSRAMSLDSFAVEALADAIKVYPGRPIVNSISMEEVAEGVTKVDAVLEATAFHHPMYVGLAAGPEGPGATVAQKVDLARQIVENAAEHGVQPDQLLIDMNVFPIGSEPEEGMNFALESLESIPKIKAIHPDLLTVCGVGNLTNGLGKKPYMRKVLTSVWLDEGRKRGLDAAIINPNHYVFVQDLDAKDYELGLKIVLEHDMDAFEALEDIAEQKKGIVAVRRSSYEDLELEAAICQKVRDGFKERNAGEIVVDEHTYPYEDRIVLQVAEAVKKHDPLDFVNSHLMGAMNDLGDGFALGEVSLPHLLKSADVMKQVMNFLELYMKRSAGVDVHEEVQYKGTVVIGTVHQDVHSIGKDLARTLLENYGYRVIDLGVMTPLQGYLDAAIEHNATAIGMSALLVQTSNHMITVAGMMEEQGLAHIPVLVGGAPVNDRHAAYVAMAGQDDTERIRSNVFYCPTAMDGVNVMNAWVASEEREHILEPNREKLLRNLGRAQKKQLEDAELLATLPRREVPFDEHQIPEAPWFGCETIRMPLRELAEDLDTKTLFGLNWKFGGKAARGARGETPEVLDALLEEWIEKAGGEGWIQPQGVFGVFPCQSEGEEAIVYDPDDPRREVCRLGFSVVIGSGHKDTICAAQYFRPRESGVLDAIGLQLSTSGPQVDEQLRVFRETGDSESNLYLQGLSDRVAEDLAEHIHGMVRQRLGFEPKHGIRWSPGYPAMADTQYNKTLLDTLEVGSRLGVAITEAGEFIPTGTTAAVVCFHPDARYT
jgi:5-methyltetrahydrofolate--homocysteine methyltransferase